MQNVSKKKILKKVIAGITSIISLLLIGVFVFLATNQTNIEEIYAITVFSFVFGVLGLLVSLGELFGFSREDKNSKNN